MRRLLAVLSLSTAVALVPPRPSCPPRLPSSLPSSSTPSPPGAGGGSEERRQLWKRVQSVEAEAREMLVQRRDVGRAFEMLLEAEAMRREDPLALLAKAYEAAKERGDKATMAEVIKAARSVGPTPPLQQRILKERRTRYGTEALEDVNWNTTRNRTTTEGIEVSVASFYSESESDLEKGMYMFRYNVTVRNKRDEMVQLVSRVWEIQSLDGKKEVVRGPGVVGLQPVLEPGESFAYTSACPLRARPPPGKRVLGSMGGSYVMARGPLGDTSFSIHIPVFSLVLPL